jgi:hypothetical protein
MKGTHNKEEELLSPTLDHLNDPYVLQLIQGLSGQLDEIEELTQKAGELQLAAGRYQYQFEQAAKCINTIDDQFEYAYKNLDRASLLAFVHNTLATYTKAISKVKGGLT